MILKSFSKINLSLKINKKLKSAKQPIFIIGESVLELGNSKYILEKTKKINAIKLNIPWSDLGSWKEICKMYGKNKKKYIKKKNIFWR